MGLLRQAITHGKDVLGNTRIVTIYSDAEYLINKKVANTVRPKAK